MLVIFILAGVLTPSADPWNQTVFVAPMIGLYVISLGMASLLASRRPATSTGRTISRDLKLVFVAGVIDRSRRRNRWQGEFPRLLRP